MRRATTVCLFLAVIAASAISSAQIFSSIYSFCALNNCPDGDDPDAPLIQGSDGDFYSTTSYGGGNYFGTVFKITSEGALTKLHSFCPQGDCSNGEVPFAGLVQATDGNFYGTTFEGGTYGVGTVFRITPEGVFTKLHDFQYPDGTSPGTALIQATDGNLYGTAGGGSHNQGVIFRITLDGSLTVVYSFCSQPGCTDGKGANGPLFQASDGNFYSTAEGGGA